MDTVFSVSALNRAVNERLSRDPELARVRVRGEVSGLKAYPSGHLYFTLKDDQASVSCVFFRQAANKAPFTLTDGMQVLLLARTNLYDKNGRFQLIVDGVQEEGVGDLYRRFLQLKEKLAQEGLFDPGNKKPLPFIPDRIVAITSEAGAVIRDIIHVLRRRFPGTRLILIPVPVQGAGAEHEIAAAIEIANHLELGDLIIVGRGGGSQEDLQPFNEEVTARAIAGSAIPVISAVGHETDFTIADLAADLRAPTPSAAAELAVPVKADLQLRLEQLASSLEQALLTKLDQAAGRVGDLSSRPVLVRPENMIAPHLAKLELMSRRLGFAWVKVESAQDHRARDLAGRLSRAFEALLERQARRADQAARSLETLSPLAVLSRGYSLVIDPEGRAVTQAAELERGDPLELVFQDGQVGCEITRPLS